MLTEQVAWPGLAPNEWTPCWESLNKLAWADAFVFSSHGASVGVRVSDRALLGALRERLPAGARPSAMRTVDRFFSVILGGKKEGSRIKAYNLLYLNHALSARSHKLDDVLDTFETWVRLSVAELARKRIFVHAGVVGWKGRAIVLPGKTFSGKTTLVMEFIRAGASYYSDEFAVLDERGRVHPFLKPLAIRTDETGRQHKVAVQEIGGREATKPIPVGLVVISEYRSGARWRAQKISPGMATLELLSHTVSARRAPIRALTTLERIASAVPVLKSRRGEAAATVANILQAMG